MKLSTAVLCVDCEKISWPKHDRCEFCGGRGLLPLARVLQPMNQPESAEVRRLERMMEK